MSELGVNLHRHSQNKEVKKCFTQFESCLLLLQEESNNIDHKTLNTLVAEDNAMNQKLINKVLTRLGNKVEITENGRIAYEMSQQKTYDLIFMDLRIPVMDG